MANIKRFHPGVYIKENLIAMEMTAKEFSYRTGISERTLSSIINEKGSITFDVAYKLSLFFDNSINYWTNLQNQYDIYINEKTKEKELKEEIKLFNSIKKYLFILGFISTDDSKETNINRCRSLVGVNSLTLLCKEDSFVCLKKQHIQNKTDCFFQNFWIALALNEARKKNGIPFNKELLKNSIQEIRKMTIQDPMIFYPRLQELLSQCGISFILLPYLSKSNIYGVTKWFSKDNVMLAISNRSEKADLFWFTLFHEISHVLMEHRRETLFNIEGNLDEEADKMAEDMLIARNEWNEFISEEYFTEESIRKFANKIGIHPCIVLGRLHKEKKVPYNELNKYFNLNYQINYKS